MQPTATVIAAALAIMCLCAAGVNSKQTKQPYTSFQTPTEYRADNDIRTDAVIVYSDLGDRIRSWKERGYVVQTMYGFRTYEDYVRQHPDEVQTRADGTMHTCGPGSYYMVPTQRRIRAAIDYFANAMNNGTSAVIPEEPEFFAVTGYSESFKKAWSEHYGEPWQDQTSSIEARYKSERLKAKMQYDMVRAIMEAAEKQDPRVTRMVACHSPVSYAHWGIIFPHYRCLTIPGLQEIIGQVWTGTARTPCRYEGVVAERTFEYGFLEYSSLFNLARGSGRRMWFLMDPLEDNPDRSMDDYHTNYEKTLVASLMFPDVNAYEVMPWPTRIYGRVPEDYATQISAVINVLQDMHNHTTARFDTGTQGIATFAADSMGWQRGEPHRSDFDCFTGLTLPLIHRGIPIQVAQLERAPVKGYLDRYRVLFVSYDILKPMSAAYNQALADWTRNGGVLVCFGGTDAYNGLREWWTRAGYESPQADLYARLGVGEPPRSLAGESGPYTELARANERIRDLQNRNTYSFRLKPFAENADAVYVRLRDAFPDDGWGPLIRSVKLTVDDRVVARFTPGSAEEVPYLFEDGGSASIASGRFADGDAYVVYRFETPRGSSPVLELDLGNQFVVEATGAPQLKSWRLLRTASKGPGSAHKLIDVPRSYPLTLFKVKQGQIYYAKDQLGAVMFERQAGIGTLLHVGISPAYFASSPKAADFLRSIAKYACEKAGIGYVEQQRMGIRRGPYVAMRTFEGEKRLTGAYVDLLDPRLSVVVDPVVGPWSTALYADVTEQLRGIPTLLFAAGRVESRSETDTLTSLRISGPLNTRGAARIHTGGREPASVRPEGIQLVPSGDTVLLQFDNDPESLEINIEWR